MYCIMTLDYLMTLFLLSNNYKIKLMKQKVSCNKLVVSILRVTYIQALQNNVMLSQMVNGFNRINIVCNVDLNYDKENVSLLSGIPHIFNTSRDKSRSVT